MHLAKRTRLLSLTFLFFSLLGANFMAQAAPKPKVIIFDVNETLLDLETMRTSIGEALDGQEELTTLWFSTMLHHRRTSCDSN